MGDLWKYQEKAKTIIHLLDKIIYPFNSMHDYEILSQIKLGKQKIIYFAGKFEQYSV